MNDIRNDFDLLVTKFQQTDQTGLVRGIASTESVDQAGDVILASAWEKALNQKAARRVLMLNQHDTNREGPIGTWDRLWVENKELHVEGRLNLNIAKAREIHSMLNEDLDSYGLSVGFTLPRSGYKTLKTGGRLIAELTLKEISFVTWPCATDAKLVAVKSGWAQSIREFERTLYNLGDLSRREAKLAAVGGYELMTKATSDSAASILADTLIRIQKLN